MKPHPTARPHATETYQVLHIFLIIPVVFFLSHRELSLVSPQEQVLPPHGVSQVKDQVLKGEDQLSAPQPAQPLLFHSGVGNGHTQRGGTQAWVSVGQVVGSGEPESPRPSPSFQ